MREDRLRSFHARAVLLTTPGARPYLKAPIKLPLSDVEFFFDIEVDPLRDVTYLHGIVERRGGGTASERFFVAASPAPGCPVPRRWRSATSQKPSTMSRQPVGMAR